MAERTTTARPYAKAIFALARRNNTRSRRPSAGLIRGRRSRSLTLAGTRCWAARTSDRPGAARWSCVNGVAGAHARRERTQNFFRCSRRTAGSDCSPRSRLLFEQMKAEVGERGGRGSDVRRRRSRADQESRHAAALQKKLGAQRAAAH